MPQHNRPLSRRQDSRARQRPGPLKPEWYLRRPGGLQLDARSCHCHSIEFSVELGDSFGTRVVVGKIGRRQVSFSSERVALQLDQLTSFLFDSGGWVRHHENSPEEF